MNATIGKLRTVKTFLLIFIATLLMFFHYFFTYFINSTYLKGFLGETNVGYVYAVGALFNIFIFIKTPAILRRIGNYKLVILMSVIAGICLLGLAFSSWLPLILGFFILYQTVAPIIMYSLDIFLEKFSSPEEMGSIRGIYLTMMNIPPIVAPFIAGLILTNSTSYWKIYVIALAFLIPFVIIINNFRNFEDPLYPKLSVKHVLREFYDNHNIFDVFLDDFLLHLFYAWFAIYMPIYLHDHVGFQWSEIGVMFSIMLLPFVILQIPIGRMLDQKRDEKFILILGFSLMAGATILVSFVTGNNFALWTGLLFVSRIGASIVEVATESYFFRLITPENAGFVSFFRIDRSLPYLITPIVGILLIFMDFKYTFLILGIIMLLGIRYAFQITEEVRPKKVVTPTI